MYLRYFIFIITCVGASSLIGQTSTAKRSADDDWQKLTAPGGKTVSVTTPGASSSDGKAADTGTQVRLTDAQLTAALKQTAQNAKDFQANFPTDSRVAQAKKIEAVSLVKAVRPADSDNGQAAFQTATIFRKDLKNSASDRFEVAALIERQQYSVQGNGKVLAKDVVQHEKTADKLRTEFGDIPEVYAFYLGVVNTADTENANRVALRVQQLPAPAYAKAEAQVTVDRHALIGKRLDQKFTDASGQTIALSEAGKVTIIYVWPPASSEVAFKALEKYKTMVPSDARWVYVALNSPASVAEVAKRLAPFPGTYCAELPQGTGPFTSALKIRHMPFVYVFGKDGTMAGYGRLEDLPALLTTAKR